MQLLEGYERECAVCGKRFYARPDWAYQERASVRDDPNRATRFFCSWKCLRKDEDRTAAEKLKGRRYL